ncbi:MAG TPA: hypothetical protein VHV78_11235 [Gemmatimonadaceae bacterium]|jgi:hypothetical protein|nr:hypothetical protein [Gemmatimonadaceae bacterium]
MTLASAWMRIAKGRNVRAERERRVRPAGWFRVRLADGLVHAARSRTHHGFTTTLVLCLGQVDDCTRTDDDLTCVECIARCLAAAPDA